MKHKPKKALLTLERQRNLYGYIFVIPFLIGLICIFLPMLIKTIGFSFSDIKINGDGYMLKNVGLKHYNEVLFVDPYFVRQMLGSLSSLVVDTAIILIYSLFISTLLSREIKGRGLIRAIMFLPVIIATGIIDRADSISAAVLSNSVLSSAGDASVGLFTSFDIENLIMSLQLGSGFVDVIVGVINNMYSIITKSGVQILIFLAGLQSISPAIYESATVEGATWWESFWKITFPMITPMLIVNTVYTVVDSFTSYNNELMSRIFNLINGASYSTASSMSLLYFAVLSVVLAIIIAVMNRMVFYENR
ncbi:MAG: sugar ABC transporter permease [Oscillospiraceae bacterium]|nr:sugar ABC transporter permease [Oscillospiraceae bacterium]